MMSHSLLLAIIYAGLFARPWLQFEPPITRLVNGLGLLILLSLSGLCFIAFMTVLTALLPGAGGQTQTALLRSPWRAFWIGLANYLFLGGISLVLLNIERLAIVGLLIAALLATVTAMGLIGLVNLVGERLGHLRGQTFSPWQRVLWGTLALELAALLPLAGWFILTPVVLMLSFGAAVLAWRNRKQSEPVES